MIKSVTNVKSFVHPEALPGTKNLVRIYQPLKIQFSLLFMEFPSTRLWGWNLVVKTYWIWQNLVSIIRYSKGIYYSQFFFSIILKLFLILVLSIIIDCQHDYECKENQFCSNTIAGQCFDPCSEFESSCPDDTSCVVRNRQPSCECK